MKIPKETSVCAYCSRPFVRAVRKHPRLYCSGICERRDGVQPVSFKSLPEGDAYEDREHILLDYEGRLDEE